MLIRIQGSGTTANQGSANSKTGVSPHPGSFVKKDLPISIALVAVSSPNHYTLWNSLAVESLAGDLRGVFKNEIRVSVSRIRSDAELVAVAQSLLQSAPAVIGISVECGGEEHSLELSDRINQAHGIASTKPPLILFGGKIPTYFPDLFLKRHPASVVVMGEGEHPLRQLVRRWLGHESRPLTDIANLALCSENGEVLRTTATPPECTDLSFPPSLDTVQELIEAGAGTFLTQASRGCSWSKCTYCTVPSFRLRKQWEPLPWRRTLQHLEGLAGLGVREFEFCDDEFMGGREPEHLDRMSGVAEDLRLLGKNCDGGIAFRIFLIPHTIYRETDDKGNALVLRALNQLRDAGLVRVYFGVESGSESQLKRYCRGTTLKGNVGALDTVKRLRLGIDCGFIMFDPNVTTEEIRENVLFFRRQGLIAYNQWPFRPLVANEGSGFGLMMARRGVVPDPEYMCYRYRFTDPIVQVVFDAVDSLSSETRSLFYALKVISKTHFDPRKETFQSRRARDYIIENGLVYLDLIEDLLNAIADPPGGEISSPVVRAQQRVRELVNRIAGDISQGILKDSHGRLRSELQRSLPQAGSTFTYPTHQTEAPVDSLSTG